MEHYSQGNNSPLMTGIQHYSSNVNVSSDKLNGYGFVKKYFIKMAPSQRNIIHGRTTICILALKSLCATITYSRIRETDEN
jgi:hypothetical protein